MMCWAPLSHNQTANFLRKQCPGSLASARSRFHLQFFGQGQFDLVGVEGEKFPRAQVQSGGNVQHVQAAVPARHGVAFGKGFGQPVNVRPVGSDHHQRAGVQKGLGDKIRVSGIFSHNTLMLARVAASRSGPSLHASGSLRL